MVKVIAQTFGYFGNRQGWQLAAKAADLRIKRIPPVACRDKCLARLGKERLGTRPHPKPGEPVSFGKQLMRVGDLRNSGGTLKEREQRTDNADQMESVARHDSRPRFAGAPPCFYNGARSRSRVARKQKSWASSGAILLLTCLANQDSW